MIRWALADSFRPLTSIPRARRPSISAVRTLGSTTTPLPMMQVFPGYRIPLGIRWNFQVSPSRTIVWPALLPPWKRTTASACSASRSTTLPLPSSPHWAPTITMPGIGCECRGLLGPAGVPRRLVRRAGVVAEQRDELAHLLQARDGALADLIHEILALLDVRREDHGA